MHAGFDIPLIRVSLSVELHRIHMLVGHCPAIGTNVLGDNDQFEVLNEHVITTKNNFTVCNAGFPVAADAVNPDMRVAPTYTFRRWFWIQVLHQWYLHRGPGCHKKISQKQDPFRESSTTLLHVEPATVKSNWTSMRPMNMDQLSYQLAPLADLQASIPAQDSLYLP